MSRWLVGSSSSSRSGFGDQRLREQRPPPPAARERADRPVRRKPQLVDHELDPLLEAPAILALEPVLELGQVLELAGVVRVLGQVGRGVMVGGDDFAERAETGRDFVEDRAIAGAAGHFLLETRDAKARGPPDRPLVERDLAGDGLQQARLAAAVAADERDPFARLDAQVGVLEERQMAEGEMPLLKMKDWQTLIIACARARPTPPAPGAGDRDARSPRTRTRR